MLKKFIVIFLVMLATGCASSGNKVTDYTDRSVVYGWLDIDDVDGNHMFKGYVEGVNQENKANYYGLTIKEFKGGFVFYNKAVRTGVAKLYSVDMQSCLGFMCSNVIYTYDFSGNGAVLSVKIGKPGTYHMGNYVLSEADAGLFERSKFSVTTTKRGPGKREILEFILESCPDLDPVVLDKIKKSIRRESMSEHK